MIVLQFSRQRDIGSAVIATFSAGHFSHVDVVGVRGLLGARSDTVRLDNGLVIPPGVQWRPHGYATWSETMLLELQVDEVTEYNFWLFMNAQEKKSYDHWAIWGFIMARDWREQDTWICSELVTAALEYCHVFKRAVVRANKVTPVALSFAASVVGFKRPRSPLPPTDQTFPRAA